MAALGHVSANSQGNYESNKRSPDAEYLEAIGKAGADIGYIVTGERTGNVVPPGQNRMLGKLLGASMVDQQTIARVIDAILDDREGVSPNPADNLPDVRLLTKMFETLLRVAEKLPADRRAATLAQSLPAALRAIEGDWVISEDDADRRDELPLDDKRRA